MGFVAGFRQGLCETGFVDGRILAIAFRWADGRYDSLPVLAAELVDLPVTLIFAAGGPPTAFAVKAATSTIPIVFSASATRLKSVWSRASTSRAATSRAWPCSTPRLRENVSS